MHRILLVFFFLVGFAMIAHSRAIESSGRDSTCFHININRINELKSVEFIHPDICLDFYDSYGIKDTLDLFLYDWRGNLLSHPRLKKSYGNNSYSINLNQYNIEAGKEAYRLKVFNDAGKKYILYFKLLPPPEKPDPIVDIFVNPVELQCEEPTGNLIEFYGTIDGGKAPYNVSWVIMNEGQTSLLYQPRRLTISKPGYTPSIQINKSPSYAVMLHVTDACGNDGQQIVNIQCKPDIEKSNNLFIELLPDSPAPKLTDSNQ